MYQSKRLAIHSLTKQKILKSNMAQVLTNNQSRKKESAWIIEVYTYKTLYMFFINITYPVQPIITILTAFLFLLNMTFSIKFFPVSAKDKEAPDFWCAHSKPIHGHVLHYIYNRLHCVHVQHEQCLSWKLQTALIN